MELAEALLAAPRGPEFACTVIRVHDGDGPIHCREGQRIRLSGIAAREIDDNSCRPGHPCPTASAEAAKAALERLTLRQVLRCRQTGTSYDRIVADCTTPAGADLACAMIGTGTVLRGRATIWQGGSGGAAGDLA